MAFTQYSGSHVKLVTESVNDADSKPPSKVLSDDKGGSNNFDGEPDWAPDGQPHCRQNVTTSSDTPVTIELECTDTGPAYERTAVDGFVANGRGPANGTTSEAAPTANPATVKYTPKRNFSGVDKVVYNSVDAFGPGTDMGTVFITVNAGPAKPKCAGRTATIVGTSGRDTLLGTRGRDVIVAGAGNDRVRAGPGNDIVCGGRGRDRLGGGRGNDRIGGGSGNDRANGESATTASAATPAATACSAGRVVIVCRAAAAGTGSAAVRATTCSAVIPAPTVSRAAADRIASTAGAASTTEEATPVATPLPAARFSPGSDSARLIPQAWYRREGAGVRTCVSARFREGRAWGGGATPEEHKERSLDHPAPHLSRPSS